MAGNIFVDIDKAVNWVKGKFSSEKPLTTHQREELDRLIKSRGIEGNKKAISDAEKEVRKKVLT